VKPHLYFYTQNLAPRLGAGVNNRLYSNMRAYLDLGYEVEWVQLCTTSADEEASPDLRIRKRTKRNLGPPVRTLPGRVAFALGLTTSGAWNFYFPTATAFREEAEARERAAPGSLHHFELPLAASAIPWLRGMKTIWSCHDIGAHLLERQYSIDRGPDNPKPQAWEKRRLRYLDRAERLTARRSSLVLCIADCDAEHIRNIWGCPQAQFFPMSMAREDAAARHAWLPDGQFRLLHLGGLGHFPTYRSLEFLLEKIFPLIHPDALARIRVNVVGKVPDEPHVKRLVDAAARYPQVRFLGFVDKLPEVYAGADLQIVASTEATGFRTRIVESFAFGVPVFSTTVASRGTAGLRPGENILIADDAETYARRIESLLRDPAPLDRLSREGRSTYDSIYSRRRVAEQLDNLLTRYAGGNVNARS
jgi:glycosyltransferase involved in cell wall biosynthesis